MKRNIPENDLIRSACRQSFAAFAKFMLREIHGNKFVENWHHDLMFTELEALHQGLYNKLLINIAPRTFKSTIVSILFTAWLLGIDPTLKIIVASYGHGLAMMLARETRRIMEMPFYKMVFPNVRFAPDQNTKDEFHTTQGGFYMATSVGGALTGRGGDILILDDPMKAEEANSETARETVKDWFQSTFFQRLNDRNTGKMIAVMQRLHEDDLSGFLLQMGGWKHVALPAIFPEDTVFEIRNLLGSRKKHVKANDLLHEARLPRHELENILKTIGTAAFNAQFLQNPIPAEGNIIKKEWINFYSALPTDTPCSKVMSVDTASKTNEGCDYSVISVWYRYKDNFYLVDVIRGRFDYPTLKKKVLLTAQSHDVDAVIIEDAGAGIHLLQDLKDNWLNLIPYKPKTDKVTRLMAQSAKFEAGRVHVPNEASWLGDFLSELLGFPNAKYDDQVDSVSQALDWLGQNKPAKIGFMMV